MALTMKTTSILLKSITPIGYIEKNWMMYDPELMGGNFLETYTDISPAQGDNRKLVTFISPFDGKKYTVTRSLSVRDIYYCRDNIPEGKKGVYYKACAKESSAKNLYYPFEEFTLYFNKGKVYYDGYRNRLENTSRDAVLSQIKVDGDHYCKLLDWGVDYSPKNFEDSMKVFHHAFVYGFEYKGRQALVIVSAGQYSKESTSLGMVTVLMEGKPMKSESFAYSDKSDWRQHAKKLLEDLC